MRRDDGDKNIPLLDQWDLLDGGGEIFPKVAAFLLSEVSIFCFLLAAAFFSLLNTTHRAAVFSHVTIQSKLGAHGTLIAALLIENPKIISFFQPQGLVRVTLMVYRRCEEQSATDVLELQLQKPDPQDDVVRRPAHLCNLLAQMPNTNTTHATNAYHLPLLLGIFILAFFSFSHWTYPLLTSCSAILHLQLTALVKQHHPTSAVFSTTTSKHSNNVLDAKTVYSPCKEQRQLPHHRHGAGKSARDQRLQSGHPAAVCAAHQLRVESERELG